MVGRAFTMVTFHLERRPLGGVGRDGDGFSPSSAGLPLRGRRPVEVNPDPRAPTPWGRAGRRFPSGVGRDGYFSRRGLGAFPSLPGVGRDGGPLMAT